MKLGTSGRILLLGALIGLVASPAEAQGYGRVTLRGIFQTTESEAFSRDFSEVAVSVAMRSRIGDTDGFEYAFDARGSAYPSTSDRDPRSRVHDAWIGRRSANGALAVRAGQMWLNELGGIGAVGGAMAEYRQPTRAGRLRLGLFGGAEPKNFETGFAKGISKGGTWVALDGAGMRRHVLGYVTVRHSGLTERSVLTAMNVVPVGKRLFVYQTAEYDLSGPGGTGDGGLNYFFANARYMPARRVEVTGSVHRGRSIDARTISQEILDGRPVDQKSLEGFLFESVGGRVTVEVRRNVRLHAGYARDRNNREDESAGRISAGIWASNIGGSGFDVTLSDNRIERGDRTYDAIYASVGHSAGSRVYLSADYSTSLAVVRVVGDGGAIVETRPRTKRYGLNAVWHLTRVVSVLLGADRLEDERTTDDRGSFAVTYRF